MKNTSKLILGLSSALILIILAIFFVTKFNSQESARVTTTKSSIKTSQTSSSSSRKSVKKNTKNNKSEQSSSVASSEASKTEPSSEVANATSEGQNATASESNSTTEASSEAQPQNDNYSVSSLDLAALDNGDISSLVGTWTNAHGESVTINADGTIVKNSTGFKAVLDNESVSDNAFHAGIYSGGEGVSLTAVPGGADGSDYLVIGQSDESTGITYYRN